MAAPTITAASLRAARLEVRRLEPTGFVSQEARDTDVMVGMRWAAH